MIVPFAHLDELQKLPELAAQEMMALTQKMESVLRQVYSPDGINLGMNIGRAAGVVGHVHMHVLPRWVGDTNFMTVVGESRVCRSRWRRPTRESGERWIITRMLLVNQVSHLIVIHELSAIGGRQALLHLAQKPFRAAGVMNQRVTFPVPGREAQKLLYVPDAATG
jgi:diadenosine tetraphosphate (Ap4A) HIT family hydrolase